MGFIRKLWRRHKVKAAERRVFMDQDQEHAPGHVLDDARRTAEVNRLRSQIP